MRDDSAKVIQPAVAAAALECTFPEISSGLLSLLYAESLQTAYYSHDL